MSKIVLISCVSQKQEKSAKAKDIYISPLFKYNFKYAKMLNPDNIFILSAKYGLLTLEQEIDPYNETLNNFSAPEKKVWSDKVLTQLKKVSDLKNDEFIFLAGENYRKNLIPHLNNYKIPMKGLGIGKQLGYLKEKVEVSEKCGNLHELFNKMEKIQFPFSDEKIPKNGIYILFENGEESHYANRIVRIGTHTGDNQLLSRLKQHFMNENKDRSIFRKNIGRALLNKENDPFLEYWELDLTTKKAKEKYQNLIDFNKQDEIEKRVTQYLQNNLSFVVFEVNEKKKRLEIESKIISTVSLCEDCRPSDNWLGNYSPKVKIRESGLWLVNELYKDPLSDEDLDDLKTRIL